MPDSIRLAIIIFLYWRVDRSVLPREFYLSTGIPEYGSERYVVLILQFLQVSKSEATSRFLFQQLSVFTGGFSFP